MYLRRKKQDENEGLNSMIEIYDKNSQRIPIKAWVEKIDDIDFESQNQALSLSRLTFAYSHVALMPDVHSGFGMPIGGVVALDGVVIPNAVGVDIGCGIVFAETDIDIKKVSQSVLIEIKNEILNQIPMGFDHRKVSLPCKLLDEFKKSSSILDRNLNKELEKAYYQLGTLGGGNHFIEIQKNTKGKLCVMVHSGSRHFGHQIANYFHNISIDPKSFGIPKDLSYLKTDSIEGKSYIQWMHLALSFAKENRKMILKEIIYILRKYIDEFRVDFYMDVHHNYANLESIDGRQYWIHRKGAISAKMGELGIVPSVMGGESFIVEGKGNLDSFQSCSHGAGRAISRKSAKIRFSEEETSNLMKNKNILLGKKKKSIISDEDPRAYKDIYWVIDQEKDLMDIVDKVKTVIVIKG
ncbi:MAG: RtcB family protein [Clostridiales bacterium]|nr:RtcB family protein [Clostridiales bacterium]